MRLETSECETKVVDTNTRWITSRSSTSCILSHERETFDLLIIDFDDDIERALLGDPLLRKMDDGSIAIAQNVECDERAVKLINGVLHWCLCMCGKHFIKDAANICYFCELTWRPQNGEEEEEKERQDERP